MDDLIFNEKLRAAHERWAHCQMLVVVLSRAFVEHPRDKDKRAELRGVLQAEARARLEFEALLKAEQQMQAREAAEAAEQKTEKNGKNGKPRKN